MAGKNEKEKKKKENPETSKTVFILVGKMTSMMNSLSEINSELMIQSCQSGN